MENHAVIEPGQQEESTKQWSVAHPVVFRFCFVYFILYCLANQTLTGLFPIPNVDIPDLSTLLPIRATVFWVGAHVFHAPLPLIYKDSGSGDKTFDWVLTFCVLVVALVATSVWSVLDRSRGNYTALGKWFRVFIRFALAAEMIGYGFAKLVPLQMGFPSLIRLLQPYGSFSTMGVLWTSIGASPAYEMFAGSAEVLGGILLVLPRTALLGALISAGAMVEVFMLNMTYDVPVKLYSFHLLLMASFLIAPDFLRLRNVLLLGRAARATGESELFARPRANRIAVTVQILFGVLLIAANVYGSWTGWHTYGGGAPKSPLYGIWEVRSYSVDGLLHPPLLSDKERFRRVVFDSPDRTAWQKMDDSFTRYGASIDVKAAALVLSKDDDKKWKAQLHYLRTAPDKLTIQGPVDGHAISMELLLIDRNSFLLVNRGFHWVQEYPFNR